jgi:hypothetical protein
MAVIAEVFRQPLLASVQQLLMYTKCKVFNNGSSAVYDVKREANSLFIARLKIINGRNHYEYPLRIFLQKTSGTWASDHPGQLHLVKQITQQLDQIMHLIK